MLISGGDFVLYYASPRPLSMSELRRLYELQFIVSSFVEAGYPEPVEVFALSEYELREYRYLSAVESEYLAKGLISYDSDDLPF